MARLEGCHKKTKIRENQREENVDACGGFVQGISSRICYVSQLLPWSKIWRRTWLHVFEAVVPNFIPHSQPSVWLHFRLDHAETKSCPISHGCNCSYPGYTSYARGTLNTKKAKDKKNYIPTVSCPRKCFYGICSSELSVIMAFLQSELRIYGILATICHYYSSTNIKKSGLKSYVLNKHLNPVIHRVFNMHVHVKKKVITTVVLLFHLEIEKLSKRLKIWTEGQVVTIFGYPS